MIPVSEFQGLHIGDAGYRAEPEGALLHNGASFVMKGEAFRLWLPQNYAPSVESTLMLSDNQCRLDIYPQDLKAIFTQGRNSASLQGEMVRVLWVYAQERLESDGWIDSLTALERWTEYGGNTSSDVARVSWERNKIRKYLLDQSVLSVDSLFERYRQGTVWFHRLSFESKQISILTN